MKWLPLLVFLTGCATVDYFPYTGDQSHWQVASGALVRPVAGIPIYRGLPDKPYHLLGVLTAVDISERGLADEAKKHHADAVVILKNELMDGGTLHYRLAGNLAYSGPVERVATRAALIVFTNQLELRPVNP